MKILYVHGIGGWDAIQPPGWQDHYRSVLDGLLGVPPGPTPEYRFLSYDFLFAPYLGGLSTPTYYATITGLLAVDQRLNLNALNLTEQTRWTAGMVVVWYLSAALRDSLRQVLLGALEQFRPDLLLCHSMGSLIAYDLFTAQNVSWNGVWVTQGTQIAYPTLWYRPVEWLRYPPGPSRWYWLFNQYDTAFAWHPPPVAFTRHAGFQPVITPFEVDTPGAVFQNHNDIPVGGQPFGSAYLTHPNAQAG